MAVIPPSNVFPPPERLLLGPGPSQVHPRVLAALGQPLLGHLDPAFVALMEETKRMLRVVFGTTNELTIPISGTGSAGLEATIVNLVEPGDEVVIGVNGVFGTRLTDVAERAGATVVRAEAPWGEIVPAETLAAALGKTKRPRLLVVVHAETSTGVWQPLADACQIARENDASLDVLRGDIRHMPLPDGSVDAVLSLGVVEHDESGPMEALHETRRILKKGGLLVLAVPYNNPFRRLVFNPMMTYMTWKRRRAQWKLGFAEYRFTAPEVWDFLGRSGFEILGNYPNELKPPKNMGLWVDYNNLTINPFRPLTKEQLFIFPGVVGRIAGWLTQRLPWLVCGEIICVARAR